MKHGPRLHWNKLDLLNGSLLKMLNFNKLHNQYRKKRIGKHIARQQTISLNIEDRISIIRNNFNKKNPFQF